jgi:threonine/homoserine/homoserine lactone efflux protein
MEIEVLVAAGTAGAIYTLTPGPGVLAVLGIGAAQGRLAGAGFLLGHLIGDLLWACLALVAIIGAKVIDPIVFDLLALVCGAYLFWLGIRAVLARRRSDGQVDLIVRHPLRRGVIFGLTNPKSYPVAVAMFTALLASEAGALSWSDAPSLLGAALAGFLTADLILIWLVGLGMLRRLYLRRELWIVRVTGALFIGFATHAVANALPHLAVRLPSWVGLRR